MSKSTSTTGFVGVLIASALWGLSGVWVKLVLTSSSISALSLAFWRDIITFLLLYIGARLFRPDLLKIRRKELRWLVGLGVSLGIFHVFWNLAVMLNGAAVATVQQAAMPALVAVLAFFIWGESLTRVKILAIVLTFFGTFLVSGLDVFGQFNLTLEGFFVGLGLPLFYAFWNLFGKKARQQNHALTVLIYGFGVAAAVLLPFQFFTPQLWPVPLQTLLAFIGLIIVSTIGAFFIYTFALGYLPASVATIVAMSEIAFVAVYALLILGERLTLNQYLGAALVVGGVLLLFRKTDGD